MAEYLYPIRELDWDTRLFGVNMGEVIIGKELEKGRFSKDQFLETIEASKERYHFLLCQFDTRYQEIASFLVEQGGKIGDVLLTLGRNLMDPIPGEQHSREFRIGKAEAADLDEICAISAASFRYSRVFQDSRFDNNAARRFYPEWLTNSFNTGAEEIWVVKSEQKVAGFLSWQEALPERNLIIRLIAVHQDWRGKGLGRFLLENLIAYGRDNGNRYIRVGTQVNNYEAIRLYEKTGFRLDYARYRFHIWLDRCKKSFSGSSAPG